MHKAEWVRQVVVTEKGTTLWILLYFYTTILYYIVLLNIATSDCFNSLLLPEALTQEQLFADSGGCDMNPTPDSAVNSKDRVDESLNTFCEDSKAPHCHCQILSLKS